MPTSRSRLGCKLSQTLNVLSLKFFVGVLAQLVERLNGIGLGAISPNYLDAISRAHARENVKIAASHVHSNNTENLPPGYKTGYKTAEAVSALAWRRQSRNSGGMVYCLTQRKFPSACNSSGRSVH